MNRYVSIAVIILLTISMCIISCGDENDASSTPEDTVKAWLSAWQDGDIEKAKTYYTERYAVTQHFDEYEEEADVSLQFYDIETSLLKKDEDTAKVEVSYDSELTFRGETGDRHNMEIILHLVKENNVWLIDDGQSVD